LTHRRGGKFRGGRAAFAIAVDTHQGRAGHRLDREALLRSLA
jgi:hypothetical protein